MAIVCAAAAPALAAGQPAPIDCEAVSDAITSGPTVVVTSPTPADLLTPDGSIIQGAAFDCHADEGIGVDRVSAYLGNRDSGGVHLGDATLGQPSGMNVLPVAQYRLAGWTLKLAAPVQDPARALSIYAHSTISGRETMVVVPLGSAQNAAPVSSVPSGTDAVPAVPMKPEETTPATTQPPADSPDTLPEEPATE